MPLETCRAYGDPGPGARQTSSAETMREPDWLVYGRIAYGFGYRDGGRAAPCSPFAQRAKWLCLGGLSVKIAAGPSPTASALS